MARKKTAAKKWTRFERGCLDPAQLDGHGASADFIRDDEIWVNSHYQVNLRRLDAPPGWPCAMVHLSVKRLDKHPARDWRHFQWIKNELVGDENEAIEIYPAESRMVDTANQYHLWVFADAEVRLPVGFHDGRFVSEGGADGSKQRDWPAEMRPGDCESIEDVTARMEEMARRRTEVGRDED